MEKLFSPVYVSKLRNILNNSTTIFHGVLYTLIDIVITSTCSKRIVEPPTAGEWCHCKEFEHFDVIPLVDRCVDHRKSLSICFLTLTVSYANCHYVPLRFFFFLESSRARKTNNFTFTSFPWSVLFKLPS